MDVEDGVAIGAAPSAPAAPRTAAAFYQHPRAHKVATAVARGSALTHLSVALIVDGDAWVQHWRPREA